MNNDFSDLIFVILIWFFDWILIIFIISSFSTRWISYYSTLERTLLITSNLTSESSQTNTSPRMLKIPSSKNILLLIIHSTPSLSVLEEPVLELHSVLSNKVLKQLVFQSFSPQDLTQSPLKEVLTPPSETCTMMTGDGTHMIQLKVAIGWEIKMPSIICADKLQKLFWN